MEQTIHGTRRIIEDINNYYDKNRNETTQGK